MCGNYFVVFCLWTNKVLCLLLWIFIYFPFHWRCCFWLYCPFPSVLMVVSGPSLVGKFSWMFLSGVFEIILSIVLPWLMPWYFSLCCILHALVLFPGAFIVSVCFTLVLGKNIHLLCFVPMVLICMMHPNMCVESFYFLCILLLRLDVLHCNFKTKFFCGFDCWIFLYRHIWVSASGVSAFIFLILVFCHFPFSWCNCWIFAWLEFLIRFFWVHWLELLWVCLHNRHTQRFWIVEWLWLGCNFLLGYLLVHLLEFFIVCPLTGTLGGTAGGGCFSGYFR